MSKRAAAIELAQLGWRLIPIFWVEQDDVGRFFCGCGNPLCPAPGKHPLTKMGKNLENATSSLTQVGQWWDQWPNANIAVACGRDSGVVVIDCDNKNTELGGAHEFEAWLAGQGLELPETMMARTGGGGTHYIFRYPDDGIPIKNCVGWLPDVDVKSDGGYILVAPSVHISGVRYEWASASAPALLPDAVKNSIRVSKSGGGPRKRKSDPAHADTVGDEGAYDFKDAVINGAKRGYRDDAFNSYAYLLRKIDTDWDEAIEKLHTMWERTDGVEDPNDPYPWDSVVEKAKRIWGDDTITPEKNPDWDPWSHVTGGPDARPRAVVIDGRPQDMCTDTGNAWQMLELHKDVLRWTSAMGWLVWNGNRWARDENERIMEFARKTTDHIYLSAVRYEDEQRDRMLKWASQTSSSQRTQAMIRMTATYDMHKCSLTDFDANPWVLSVPNGTLDLKTGELRDALRTDLITKGSAVPYVPGATDPMWDHYLQEACNGDAELISYLQRAAGYTLTGSTVEEALFVLYGPKASGKSTFVDAMTTILGDYAMSTQPENLMHRKGSSIPKDEIARMRGRRLVTSVEPAHGERFAESLLKQMTGGDMMSGRFLYKDTFEFKPTHKIWIATNTKPRASDDALFRRLKLLPFPVTVPFERRNNQLKLLLNDPNSNLTKAAFAWAVQGCIEWQRYGLGTAMIVEQETKAYQDEEDVIGQFIAECTTGPGALDEEGHEAVTKAKELYTVYGEWSGERGERPMTYQSFNKSLEERGIKRGLLDRQQSFRGVRLTRTAWTGGL
jgi:putative DNA primase/helicase